MSIRDKVLGGTEPSANMAAAIKAVEAAQAALEAAYVNLLAAAQSVAVRNPDAITDNPENCNHPHHQRTSIESFGGIQYLCGVCGEMVDDR